MADFKRKVRATKFYTEEQIQEEWAKHGADDSGMVSFEIANSMNVDAPQFNRDLAAGVLNLILKSDDDMNAYTFQGSASAYKDGDLVCDNCIDVLVANNTIVKHFSG